MTMLCVQKHFEAKTAWTEQYGGDGSQSGKVGRRRWCARKHEPAIEASVTACPISVSFQQFHPIGQAKRVSEIAQRQACSVKGTEKRGEIDLNSVCRKSCESLRSRR
jgi:hypothetical protein